MNISLLLACEPPRFSPGIPGLRLRAGHRIRRDPEALGISIDSTQFDVVDAG